MSTFLITGLVLNSLAAFIILCRLAASDYPRHITNTRGEENLQFIVLVGFIIWAALLLKGGAQ